MTMGSFGVIVECFSSEGKSKDTLSCSGVYLGRGTVLTHGTLLSDVLRDRTSLPLVQALNTSGCVTAHQESDLINTILRDTKSKFRVILPQEYLADENVNDFSSPNSSLVSKPSTKFEHHHTNSGEEDKKTKINSPATLLQDTNISNLHATPRSPSYTTLPASIERVLIQSEVQKAAAALMPSAKGWKLTESSPESSTEDTTDLDRLILSVFVVLTVDAAVTREDVWAAAKEALSCTAAGHKGVKVCVESSPFGSLAPGVFLNSLSTGIISNTSGQVLLTDARCVMGSEGAPVYTWPSKRGQLCGMVISPFCWKGGEWYGITLLASVRPVLQAVMESCLPPHITAEAHTHLDNAVAHKLVQQQEAVVRLEHLSLGLSASVSSSIVAVCCGGGWGSGVVVRASPGLVLTCAHVTRPAVMGRVTVLLHTGKRVQGRVIHQTQPQVVSGSGGRRGASMWDLAVVATSEPLPSALTLAPHLPPEGSTVMVGGYSLFSPNVLPSPTVSTGNLAKVVSLPLNSLHWPGSSQPGHSLATLQISAPYPCVTMNQVCESGVMPHHTDLGDGVGDVQSVCGEDKRAGRSEKSGRDQGGGPGRLSLPVLLQTTCEVYSGTSGGPVLALHPQRGLEVVGVVVCNTRDTTNNSTFPHINLAVPSPVLAAVLSAFLVTGDEHVLKYLDAECAVASLLWSLDQVPQSKL